jgi:hypothetical protein
MSRSDLVATDSPTYGDGVEAKITKLFLDLYNERNKFHEAIGLTTSGHSVR